MKFPEGNKIVYGQDFAMRWGIPHNVEFEIDSITLSHITLRGDGFGAGLDGKGGEYGNGAICIRLPVHRPNPKENVGPEQVELVEDGV